MIKLSGKKNKNTRVQMILHHLRPSFFFGWWRGKAEGGVYLRFQLSLRALRMLIAMMALDD